MSRFCTLVVVILGLILGSGLAADETLTLASTTSTLDSGLFDALIPPFEKLHRCSVKVIAVGTGQAMRLGRDGNADVLLVHDRLSEEQFVAEGFGVERLPVMHNDFLIVGPREDPAFSAQEEKTLVTVLKKIVSGKHLFVSRGDDSGTHKKELRLWKTIGSQPSGSRYIESGSGMEVTLRIANEKRAYCLVDRATWLSHRRECDGLTELFSGEEGLLNYYSVIVVSPEKFKWVKHELARKFADYLRGPEGQKIIREFGVDRFGSPLFFPDVIQ